MMANTTWTNTKVLLIKKKKPTDEFDLKILANKLHQNFYNNRSLRSTLSLSSISISISQMAQIKIWIHSHGSINTLNHSHPASHCTPELSSLSLMYQPKWQNLPCFVLQGMQDQSLSLGQLECAPLQCM